MSEEIEHVVKATSFADPRDIIRFHRCKERRGTDDECFKIGDNGVGMWGDDCAGDEPICALPPEDMEERWGATAADKWKAAHGKFVLVQRGNGDTYSVICTLKDRMPHKRNIKNGAGIDLNPAACDALGLKPPVYAAVTWQWAPGQLA